MTNITAICPKCSTQYALTEEQSNITAGQVHCGAFKTDDNTAEANDTALTPDTDLYDTRELNDALISDELINIPDDNTYELNEEPRLDENWAEQLLTVQGIKDKENAKQRAQDTARIERIKLVKKQQGYLNEIERENLRHRINSGPLELQLQISSHFWSRLIYSFAAIALITGLAAQFIYFNYDDIARNNTWRSYIQQACIELQCHVPEQYNIDDLSADFLTVKPHEIYKRSLILDTVLINHANISQPFPVIELFFTDIQQKVITARRFSSHEYLRGELSSNTLMPSQQPIRIALEIDDPGTSGYYVQLSYAH